VRRRGRPALQAQQGFSFFGKPLEISFAKEKSNQLAKREGSFDPNVQKKYIFHTSEVTTHSIK
jgi:hypothetical protein